jgi:hypothetical protein
LATLFLHFLEVVEILFWVAVEQVDWAGLVVLLRLVLAAVAVGVRLCLLLEGQGPLVLSL